MRKVFLLLFISLAFAQEQKITSLDAYKIGYSDGYEKGKKEGYLEGYKRAIEDLRKIYQEKLQEYKEIEAGKILVKEWRISYPRVYQIPTKGGSKVVIEGCQVIKPYDDLLERIPIREVREEEGKEETLEVKTPERYYKVRVKKDSEKALSQTKAIYLKEEGKEDLIAYFPDERSMREFCKEYQGACYEEDRR